MNITDKVALVTRGASGLGVATSPIPSGRVIPLDGAIRVAPK